MVVDKINFTASVQVTEGHWRKLSMEASLEPGDDPETKAEELKVRVENMLDKFAKPLVHDISETLPSYNLQSKDHEQIRIDNAIADVFACKTLEELATFKYQRLHSPKIDEAYITMLNKLSK